MIHPASVPGSQTAASGETGRASASQGGSDVAARYRSGGCGRDPSLTPAARSDSIRLTPDTDAFSPTGQDSDKNGPAGEAVGSSRPPDPRRFDAKDGDIQKRDNTSRQTVIWLVHVVVPALRPSHQIHAGELSGNHTITG